MDGVCISDTPSDASPEGSVEASTDAPVMPECLRDDDCPGGACLEQMCCSMDDVCAESCCGGDEVCFANACVVPGDPCVNQYDCREGWYCEPGLGDASTPMGGDGGMMDIEGRRCLGGAPRAGRCVELPPRCEGEEPAPGEICITSCEYRPEVGDLDSVMQWHWGPGVMEFSDSIDVWSTPTVGRVVDTNCDGSVDEQDPPNIIFVSGDSRGSYCAGSGVPGRCKRGVLRVIDGRTGEEIWSLSEYAPGRIGFSGMSVALGDVVGDEDLEIVAMTGAGHIVVIDRDGNLLMESDTASSEASSSNFGWGGGIALADMDGDGNVEVAYSTTVWTIFPDGVRQRFAGAGGSAGGVGRALSVFTNVDEDPDLELVAGRYAYDPDGTLLWEEATASGFPAVGDLDMDGTPEIVIVNGGSVRVLDALTGALELGPTNPGGSGSGGPPTIADFDGDGAPEIGIAKQDRYAMLKPNYATMSLDVVWTTPNHDLSSSVTGSTVFDFEGDGIAEVIYNDECFLWVYDGPTGNVRFSAPTNSFTATEASLVADIDADGHAEMVMLGNGANPVTWHCGHHAGAGIGDGLPSWSPPEGASVWRGLMAFRDRANSWVGTRTLWNQHSYHVSNICDDSDSACEAGSHYGEIPARARDNWSVPWLNNFRQNVQEAGLFNAPDVVVSLAADCFTPPVLRAAVRNIGAALLQPGVVVGFYVRDGDTETLLGMESTTSSLFPGQAAEVSLTTPAGTGTASTFFARILIDPAARTFRECREDNNQSPDVMPRCVD